MAVHQQRDDGGLGLNGAKKQRFRTHYIDGVDKTQKRRKSSRPKTSGDNEKWFYYPQFSGKKTEVQVTQLETVRARI